jgi:cytochrome P450 PksS
MVDKVDTFSDLFMQEGRRNPQPIYARMREESSVLPIISTQTGSRFWVATGYDECVALLKDQRIGKDARHNLPADMLPSWMNEENPLDVLNHHLLDLDPPDHTRLRALVHKAFTPGIVENLRPRIQAIADDLLDQIESQGETNLVEAYSFPLPITVIAELLGVPVEDRERFRYWTKTILFGRENSEVMAAGFEMVMYMHNLIDTLKANPQENLLSGLIAVEDEGKHMTREELISMIFLLLVAGHETTVNLISSGTLLLLQHPDQLKLLRESPTFLRSAVEEMLRFNGPVETTTIRFAYDDITIGGRTVPRGEMILASLLGANRDPKVFDRPDVFDITRDPNRHIAFGNGIHYCLGAPLARLEGTIAIETLLRRLPKLNIEPGIDDTLEWSDSLLLHGLKALPLRF